MLPLSPSASTNGGNGMPSEYVEIEGELVKPYDTEKAYHFEFDDGKTAWLPKSLVDWHPSPTTASRYWGTMVMPRWLAEERGVV